MTTSMTRSRRAEGLHPSHPNTRHPSALANAKAQNNQNFAANLHRAKRPLDASARDFDSIHPPKKARFTTGIAVEIPARPPSFHSRTTREPAIDAKPSQQQHHPPPPQASTAAKPTIATGHNAPKPSSRNAPPTTARSNVAPATAPQQQQSVLTRHKEKVVNGLKHELHRLQPGPVDTKEQGRKLRSQEATRFKSELSAYFPDYDEVIGNEPKEQHLLNLDTPIVVASANSSSLDIASQQPHPRDTYPIRSYSDSLFTDLFDAQTIDWAFLDAGGKTKSLEDHLPDSIFEPAHKKSERLERSIRNSEKGRAQHEKDQIIRLLDGLQGPDWLRVMGVSGITESRKKAFEPARDHFIKGCQAILEKFRSWAAEEKRRKLEKERAIAEAEAEAERAATNGDADDEEEGQEEEEAGEVEETEVPAKQKEIADSIDEEMADVRSTIENDADPPDESDVDASVAKQLREEALAAAKTKSRRGRRAVAQHTQPPPPPPPREPEPEKEFTSFFRKKYQRDAALSKGRRRGRNVLAWGHPVPEFEEKDFELPEKFRDEKTLKVHARRKRRSKRGRHDLD
ncbi:something about silencing, SAS, complex subunit 4-domain-containing protein [Lasiosphaeris hirsuta]|uniref:Something about silencing, SAS, complex subunit 4-domain-containing protein n=1 Tax=Lasiosphaeris hirsuta TaxID=260670 RepID=A0AA40E964_9PEZI|nr:something about silencing, SAS, complex subunit 4-domain-containing protein [Lasiosphaeris hirsuta]